MNILLVFFIFSIVPVIGVYRVARRNGRRAGTWALLTAVAIVVVYGAAILSAGLFVASMYPGRTSFTPEIVMKVVLYTNGAALLVSILIDIAALYFASRPLQKDELRGEIPPPPDFGDNS